MILYTIFFCNSLSFCSKNYIKLMPTLLILSSVLSPTIRRLCIRVVYQFVIYVILGFFLGTVNNRKIKYLTRGFFTYNCQVGSERFFENHF
jgi:hypothetical protein